MTTFHNVQPLDVPTPRDQQFWEEESRNLLWHPASPNARPGTSHSYTWGVPPDRMPPDDAIAFVLGKYREQRLGERQHRHSDYCTSRKDNGACNCGFRKLHPMYQWALISVTIAHFLWFRTSAGAKWVMGLFGVQDIRPFPSAYAYYYLDKTGKSVEILSSKQHPVYENGKLVRGYDVKVFRQWEPNQTPPCSEYTPGTIGEMTDLINKIRCPYAQGKAFLPTDPAAWNFVSSVLTTWLRTDDVDKNWPFPKANRTSGMDWIRNLERAPGTPFFEGLAQAYRYTDAVYRIRYPRDPKRGLYDTIWCGPEHVQTVPLKDIYVRTEPDDKMQGWFGCVSCGTRRTCVPHTKAAKMCCHCYGIQHERGDRPALLKCTMAECRGCPDHIRSADELTSKLNALREPGPTGPIPQ